MITCPSCNHQNPEGSLQCENCYTPLPATTSCPNCGASVQTDATFCGQCGFNLQAENTPVAASIEETAIGSMPNISLDEVSLPDELPLSAASSGILPETDMSSPIQSPWDDHEEDQTIAQTKELPNGFPEVETPDTEFAEIGQVSANEVFMPWESDGTDIDAKQEQIQENTAELDIELEQPEAKVELDISAPESERISSLSDVNPTAVHLGKPNGQIPPDIDVAGFPDSEVVSRVHADIRIEGDAYYIEDVGSSNGTYINHSPLLQGNRHRLRAGDRIALGKGDLVTFIFQFSEAT